MKIALRLARRAEGMTSPNPLVGAVVVKKGEIIGRGFHKKAGNPHAEIEAFRNASEKGYDVRSSTLYVNLEPCCHRSKRTPPCTESIISKGVSRVVVGTEDPNPNVSGKGIGFLRSKGVRVDVGVLENECRELNEVFFKYITTGKPFGILKMASSLDGKIATATGDSRWFGSERQRELAHVLRSRVDAVIVGIGTQISDDPRLNVRLKKRKVSQPVPVIVDTTLRISPDAAIFRINDNPIIVTTTKAPENRIYELAKRSKLIITQTDENGMTDLSEMADKLAQLEISSFLIEGGSSLAASAIRAGIIDKIVLFYSPRLIGGDGLCMISSLDIKSVEDSVKIKKVSVRRFGSEFMFVGYLHDNTD